MLWYLLYPFRGTTNAPDLAPDHPLRRLVTRYGVCVARNVGITLLVSVAVATAFVYPVPFLYTSDFANGAASIPQHAWTVVQPLAGRDGAEPDVVMRSVWVHGSYMRALERKVLLDALEVQEELLGLSNDAHSHHFVDDAGPEELAAGPSFTSLTNQSWLFHSPLLFWSSDREAIASDPDILATVSEHRKQRTPANVTLRSSVVFSGERFEDGSLVAADALVLTLIHRSGSAVGHRWEQNAAHLATRPSDKWTVYPEDMPGTASQLYEFQFLPISFQDSLMLGFSYSITFAYVIHSLSKLPAIKSRSGLILTIVAQIFISIMSSFTICATLKIDLSRIPRTAYPIVIVSMSLENMLRLINTVISTNLEDSTSNRIGEAFGRTAHIALVSVVEHLLLLWGVSKVVASGLSDFCIFLAIAIVFDFLCLSTFFLSVLSIEVRRTELGEAIEKASSMRRNLCSSESSPPSRASPRPRAKSQDPWLAAVLRGRVDISTRVAGTVILLGFIIIAQWHFVGDKSMFHALLRLLGMARSGVNNGCDATSCAKPSPFDVLHQARSPISWLHLQDHDTAREIINVVNPGGHSYVARVYEPFALVLKDAHRQPAIPERPFLPAVYDFARNQWLPFSATVMTITACVRTIVSYLLSDGTVGDSGDIETANEPVLSVKTLEQGHALDVALLAASPDGLVVSVGLDRSIRVWSVPFGGLSYLLTDHDASLDVPFPVLALAIDDDSVWLAILSTHMATLWNLEAKRWGPSVPVNLRGQRPEAFFFSPTRKGPSIHSLVVVRRDGMLVELWADTSESMDYLICKSLLLCAVPLRGSASASAPHGEPLSLITNSRSGCIHQVTPVGDGWVSEEVKQHGTSQESANSVVAVPQLSAYLIVKPRSVDLVDLVSSMVIHTFETATAIQARSVRCLYSIRRQSQYGSLELSYFSLVYTSAETGSCVMQTYLPQTEDGTIALYSDRGAGTPIAASEFCCTWVDSHQAMGEVSDPGKWEALPNGSIIGVRRKLRVTLHGHMADHASGRDGSLGNSSGSLRRRSLHTLAGMAPTLATSPLISARRLSAATTTPTETHDSWEAWSVCNVVNYCRNSNKSRSYMVRPLDVEQGELLVTEPGPMAQVGAGTVALGLGASIKIITMGHERFGSPTDMLDEAAGQVIQTSAVSSRRRKTRSLQKSI